MRCVCLLSIGISTLLGGCAHPEPGEFGMCGPGNWQEAEGNRSSGDRATTDKSPRSPAGGHATPMADASAKPLGVPPAAESKPKRVEFKPGIVVDFSTLQVEVASQVILRHGDLELLAWSKAPVPKEHETILVVDAMPSDVYAALGLIGLTPGSPPRFDAETNAAVPATGDRVDVYVRYQKAGQEVEHSICDWAIDKSRDAPLAKRPWVFCGSYRTENGAFTADVEGTLVTVVDFPTSLLSLAESHSESNAELWIVANTDAIPERGTQVTLIFRAADGAQ